MVGRIQRFNQALVATVRGPDPDWVQVAHACGYYDQSHLIRDFQEFAGTTPTGYLAARRALYDDPSDNPHFVPTRDD